MGVLSSSAGGAWLKEAEAEPEPPRNGVTPKAAPAEQERRRVLSNVFRCNNLVVLAGLPAWEGKAIPQQEHEQGPNFARESRRGHIPSS